MGEELTVAVHATTTDLVSVRNNGDFHEASPIANETCTLPSGRC
jgi:hypothetical protein